MKHTKKFLTLALVIVSVFAIAATALAASTMYGKCTPGEYINVRNSATGSTVVYKLRNGEPVTATGSSSNGRLQISAPVSGWIVSDFLSSSSPAWMVDYGSKTMNLATRPQMQKFQADLNKIDNISISVDGYWGPETETAVRYVQQKAGITVDGIAGTYTKLWVYDYSHR